MFFPRKDLASLKLNFPVLSCGFIDDGILAVGGGGGPTKSGLPNELVDTACSAPAEYLIRVAREALLRVFSGRRLSISHSSSYRFETTEDACQAIAAHPSKLSIVCSVNGSQDPGVPGSYSNCRIFQVDGARHVKDKKTLLSFDDDNYECRMRFSRNGKYLGTVDSTGNANIWNWPSIKKHRRQLGEHRDVVDLDFSKDSKFVALVCPQSCHVFSITGKEYWSFTTDVAQIPSRRQPRGYLMCSARFQTSPDDGIRLYVLQNGLTHPGSRIVLADSERKTPSALIHVSNSRATSFEISQNGCYMGVALSDMQIFVYSTAPRIAIIKRVKAPEWLALTSISFSPALCVLACCSVAGNVFAVDFGKEASSDNPGAFAIVVRIVRIVMSYLFSPIASLVSFFLSLILRRRSR